MIDYLIEKISPRWALNRQKAKVLLKYRKYQAASSDKRLNNWSRAKTSPNQELKNSLSALIARSQEQVRNNPYAKKAKRVLQSALIGSGIIPSARNSAAHDELWKLWGDTTECSHDGRSNFYKIENLVIASLIESGGCFIRRHRRGPTIPLSLQILDIAHCDFSKNGTFNGRLVRQGIEFDNIGRRSGYWMFDELPGDSTSFRGFQSKRVPATEILHIYNEEIPGLIHGVPWFHAALVRMRDYDEYEDHKLLQEKVATLLSGFIRDIEPLDEDMTELTERIEPGSLPVLPPGKDIVFSDPPSLDGSADFGKGILQGIAAGVSVPYERLTGNLKDVNFTSGRLSRGDFHIEMDQIIDFTIIPLLCEAVWQWFDQAGNIAGILQTSAAADWTPPERLSADPNKDANATRSRVRNGEDTPSEMIRKAGKDPETHWRQYAEDLKLLDSLGIVLDTDPRRTGGGGTAQKKENVEEAEEADE